MLLSAGEQKSLDFLIIFLPLEKVGSKNVPPKRLIAHEETETIFHDDSLRQQNAEFRPPPHFLPPPLLGLRVVR